MCYAFLIITTTRAVVVIVIVADDVERDWNQPCFGLKIKQNCRYQNQPMFCLVIVILAIPYGRPLIASYYAFALIIIILFLLALLVAIAGGAI